jgi:hypothetical protein
VRGGAGGTGAGDEYDGVVVEPVGAGGEVHAQLGQQGGVKVGQARMAGVPELGEHLSGGLGLGLWAGLGEDDVHPGTGEGDVGEAMLDEDAAGLVQQVAPGGP